MNTRGVRTVEHYVHEPARSGAQQPALRPSSLYLVTTHELQELRNALARGELPADFEAKLARLAQGDLLHRFLAQNCALFVTLLLAAQEGCFKAASAADCQRLLRVLAYVRKNDDAIPDYRIGGYVDDQTEMRAAMTELHRLLESFKVWRLRYQVPAMWLGN